MKKYIQSLIVSLFCFIGICLFVAAVPPSKNQLNKHEQTHEQCYCPFAIGAVWLENGVGTIEHPKLDWDSIPVFSLYSTGFPPVSDAHVVVCWAVSSRMQICSLDSQGNVNTNDNSLYSFAIYNGKAPGVIHPTQK